MSDRRRITFDTKLDGRQVESETTCAWVGPYVLVIATVLPEPGLAIELHSTFLGHAGVPSYSTHLRLGPVGHAPFIATVEHEHRSLDPTIKARECAYEHAQALVEALESLGYLGGVGIGDDTFVELERVER